MTAEPVYIARCPEHGLHGQRDSCFVCGGPVEQVPFVERDSSPAESRLPDEFWDGIKAAKSLGVVTPSTRFCLNCFTVFDNSQKCPNCPAEPVKTRTEPAEGWARAKAWASHIDALMCPDNEPPLDPKQVDYDDYGRRLAEACAEVIGPLWDEKERLRESVRFYRDGEHARMREVICWQKAQREQEHALLGKALEYPMQEDAARIIESILESQPESGEQES